ncbi:MarR family transcriptional regulator [Candidatus Albibeggiatoa sp. nov. BB20]|uniref:HVO_A0114 family putative DNA-binding protein n=1 Tax=Candidatus Albibeggiatoa sp. nov. BB20 TaxID=3162723 RepID=UPI003365A144
MNSEVMKIGILSKQDYMNRTIAIAKGEYKPKQDEPKVWFESIEAVVKVLNQENRILLKLIDKHNPHFIAELEKISHRSKSTLSKALKLLERRGIVQLCREKGKIIPKVQATHFKVELTF